MAKQSPEDFIDPLKDIDPIMEQAFSNTDPEDLYDTVSQETSAKASTDSTQGDAGPSISRIEFPELDSQNSPTHKLKEGLFNNIPVKVSVELGRSQISLKEAYELTEGAIVELERLVGEPLDLVINGQIIAQGEVVAIDNKYGLRIKNLVAQPNSN